MPSGSSMNITFNDRENKFTKPFDRDFKVWLIGLFVAILPLFLLNFMFFIIKKGEQLPIWDAFCAVLEDTEFFYILVTLLITAVIHLFTTDKPQNRENLLIASILVIVGNVIIYGVLKWENTISVAPEKNYSIWAVTLLDLVITLLLGVLTYRKKKA